LLGGSLDDWRCGHLDPHLLGGGKVVAPAGRPGIDLAQPEAHRSFTQPSRSDRDQGRSGLDQLLDDVINHLPKAQAMAIPG
jgi:hypothetical protein